MEGAALPRFRDDLLADQLDEGGRRFIEVLDDTSGVAFRFYEVEYALACAMDGARDVNAIIDWSERELGLRPKPVEVRTLIATLGTLGYLAHAAAAAKPAAGPSATASTSPSAKPPI